MTARKKRLELKQVCLKTEVQLRKSCFSRKTFLSGYLAYDTNV